MAIKRVIYEVDDNFDTRKPTTAPAILRDDEAKDLTFAGGTGPPIATDEVISSTTPARVGPRQGRTWPDLISESVGDERIIVPLLMAIPFVFYITTVKPDFMTTGLVGAVLIALWVSSSIIRWWRTN